MATVLVAMAALVLPVRVALAAAPLAGAAVEVSDGGGDPISSFAVFA